MLATQANLNEKAKLEAIKGLVKSKSHSNHKAPCTTGAPRDFRSIKQLMVLLLTLPGRDCYSSQE